MSSHEFAPIGHVSASRRDPEDDFWGGTEARITLAQGLDADALQGIDAFSHVEVIYLFDRVAPERIVTGARHPRNNADWPAVGIFAQRGKNRPNRIGTTICRVLRLEGRSLVVAELDAIDQTPVLDIKPVMREFLPRTPIKQPEWCVELMRQYWLPRD
ncbi:MAG: SAM-dependent methyltransferase [Burkholderiaceae bacterium]